MCGLCAIYQTNGSISQDILRQMTDCLQHRGPDDSDIAIFHNDVQQLNANQHGNIGLGHRRLKIIDLSRLGRQPMRYRHNTIVFNGEIYNYQSLRHELEQLGHEFRSESDTEVLLAAYTEWNTQFLSKLNGMFAFVIWDAQSQELLVARDRLGIKPIYYYAKDGDFIAASELKAIIKHPNVRPELDQSSVAEYLYHGYIAAPKSIFQDIYKLEPGHYLRIQNGHIIEANQYWNATEYFDRPLDSDYHSALSHLNTLLLDAVKLRMISDVPLGVLLSGGIDSTIITALMQHQSEKPVQTYTVGFDEAQFQEAHHARKIADYLGTEHTEVFLDEHEIVDIIPKIATYFDEPFADNSAIPTTAIFHTARKQVTVTLTGDGADELFLGYPTYNWITQRERVRRYLPSVIGKSMSYIGAQIPHRRTSRFAELIGFETSYTAHTWVTADWTPQECQALMPTWQHPTIAVYEDTVHQLQHSHLLHKLSAADIRNYMVNDVLTKVDRSSMSASLEARTPILDHRVVEFVVGLPLEYKYKNGQAKRLLKDLAYQYVPKTLIDRPKKGFGSPIQKWLRGSLRDLMQDHFSKEALSKHGLFDVDYVHQTQDRFLHHHQALSQKLWNLLVFQMWYTNYMR